MNIDFVTVDNTDCIKIPEWQRTAGIDENDDVFAPAALCGHENIVALAANFDGEPIAEYDDHIFLRVKWMRQNNPLDVGLLDKIERRVKEHKLMCITHN